MAGHGSLGEVCPGMAGRGQARRGVARLGKAVAERLGGAVRGAARRGMARQSRRGLAAEAWPGGARHGTARQGRAWPSGRVVVWHATARHGPAGRRAATGLLAGGKPPKFARDGGARHPSLGRPALRPPHAREADEGAQQRRDDARGLPLGGGGTADRAVAVMDEFADNYFDSKRAGLVMSCYRACQV